MFRKIFIPALFGGVIAGIFVTLVQVGTTTPLILEAELYESGELSRDTSAEIKPQADEDATRYELALGGGLERVALTGMANLVAAVGYGLLLVAAFSLKGGPVDGRRGLLWGLGAFTAIALAPSVGLPPELPGMVAAGLDVRQVWWVATVIATASGLGLLAFARGAIWKAVAVLLIVAPHAVGAPRPEITDDVVPVELAARYVAASLASSALFWIALGWVSGTLYRRYNEAEA